MIEQLSVQYGIKDSCLAIGVPRSGYYQWKSRGQTSRASQNQELVGEIASVFAAHKGRYGSPRVSRVLRERGRRVGKNRVARLMRQQKLVARKKRAFRPKTTIAAKQTQPNRIAGLEPHGPDQIWGERHYLCGHCGRLAVFGRYSRSVQSPGSGLETG